MSCPHEHDAAAYVLGALSVAERLDFERHLDTCDECSRSVRSFAGLPAWRRSSHRGSTNQATARARIAR